jgi:hypothetical protein
MVDATTARCRATTLSGSPCSAQPVRGDGWCYWHAPDLAAERDEARRRGGKGKSNAARAKKQLPAGVLTSGELQGLVGVTIKRVLTGATEPAIGNSIAALARAYIAVAEAGELEERLAELEARAGVAQARRRG